jgi:uncharacterized surface protein with fasciclin (FAS1) repeats
MKRNKSLQSIFVVAALGAIITFSSCKKSDPAPAPTPTPAPNVVGIAQSDTSFSILVAAVAKAGLVDFLSDATKNFTVFAPNNNAFRAAGYTADIINNLSATAVTNVLTPLLTYHVLGARVPSTGVPTSDTVKTLNGRNIYASKSSGGAVFINGIRVVTADLNGTNGVVHVIGSILVPPTQTIAQIVSTDPRFALLLTAVGRASSGVAGGGLLTALSSPGKYTVFAPVSTGFPAALDTDAEINAVAPAAVAAILGSHAFGTNIFASDLVAGPTGATLNPLTTLTIALPTAGPNVKITNSANAASNITTANVVATNGVIHIINTVMQ